MSDYYYTHNTYTHAYTHIWPLDYAQLLSSSISFQTGMGNVKKLVSEWRETAENKNCTRKMLLKINLCHVFLGLIPEKERESFISTNDNAPFDAFAEFVGVDFLSFIHSFVFFLVLYFWCTTWIVRYNMLFSPSLLFHSSKMISMNASLCSWFYCFFIDW